MWRPLLLLLAAASLTNRPVGIPASHPIDDPAAGAGEIISCGPPPASFIRPNTDGRYATVFPGWGHHHYPVSTANDSAQFYFDQGLSLYYSYQLAESAISFREAQVKDSNCAMAYWGEALAMGPYYNIAYGYRMPAGVLPVIGKMNALAPGASAKEKDLIVALSQRYSTDLTDSRRVQLNAAWSRAIKALMAKYPADNDIAALYIDGVMTEHAWDTWDPQGRPRPWTMELVGDCEKILGSDPDHPAALHYHIHLLEASGHPEATLASADRLKDLMPGVPHMVHMASHTYQRTGLYAKGVAVNDAATADQRNFGDLAPQLRLHPTVPHYDAVEALCAMNGGMYAKAFAMASRCRTTLAARAGIPDANAQYLCTMPLFVQVRLGKWRAILDQPLPDSHWILASLLSDFARGMAYVRTGRLAEANACLDRIREKMKDPFLAVHKPPYNTPADVSAIAEEILSAETLLAFNQPDAALVAFHHAIDDEDALTYLEPKDWPLPARHFAGACLQKLGRPGEAERLYREDLVQNPGNGWALLGLAQCLDAQHKSGAADYLGRAKTAFLQADEMPPAPAY